MKKFFLIAALVMASVISTKTIQAQVNINVNIGSQPVWGPVGYDYVEYYYLPDIDLYYYVPRQQYVYLTNGRWVFSTSLPGRYRGYDLYSGYKVVINEPRPYMHDDMYRVKYGPYKSRRNEQIIIRNSNEPKYYVVKGHPKYNDHDNGNHNGQYKNEKGKGKHGKH